MAKNATLIKLFSSLSRLIPIRIILLALNLELDSIYSSFIDKSATIVSPF